MKTPTYDDIVQRHPEFSMPGLVLENVILLAYIAGAADAIRETEREMREKLEARDG